MEHKKKYPGGLKVLLLPLFIMLLGMFSTCYARTTLTDDEAEYLWNYFFTDTFNSQVSNNNYNNFTEGNIVNKVYPSSSYQSFMNYFNSVNDLDISEKTYFFVNYYKVSNSNNPSSCNFYWYNFNNTIDDLLPYLYLQFTNTNSNKKNIKFFAIDDNKNPLDHTGRKFTILCSNSNSYIPEFTGFTTNSISTAGKSLYCNLGDWNISNSDASVLDCISGLTNLARLPLSVVYSNYDSQSFSDVPISYFYRNLYDSSGTIPDDPDIPVDTGNTGTITDNNGDTTGQVDLSGIQNGLGNINQSINTQGQAIIDNQNQNTQSIIDNQNNNTEQITETLTEQPNLSNTTISSGDIERCFRF